MADKILEVNNLTISFKTDNGLVRAVRGVSFDLEPGETLCIVGESGSGKSVTSKAIMGILAANAVIDDGSIMYQGENLLELHEDEFHKIRGKKIGMIFQDPLSSLNPIVRVGKQITEAMLINSNKIKIMYEDLISKEFIAYKNCISKCDIRSKNAKARSEKAIEKLQDDFKAALEKTKKEAKAAKQEVAAKYEGLIASCVMELNSLSPEDTEAVASYKAKINELKAASRSEMLAIDVAAKEKVANINAQKPAIKAKIVEIKADLETKLSEYKAEKDTKLPDLKAKLAVRKAEAKVEVAEYKANVTRAHNAKINELRGSIAQLDSTNAEDAAKIAELKQQIEQENVEFKNKFKITKAAAKAKALEIMREVGIPLPEKRFRQYPFEFSGGMRQRIVIAIALTASPQVLICDEPTTALDVTIQAQILELIKKIQKERNIACIFITHDLGVVANMADRVAVMYAGKIVEYGTSEEIFFDPRHPYTWALLSSIPDIDSKERLEAIPGTPPNMIFPPVGDAFALRSRYAMSIDFKQEPPYFKVTDTHYAKTWLLHPDAPKVEMPKIVSERIRIALEAQKEVSSNE